MLLIVTILKVLATDMSWEKEVGKRVILDASIEQPLTSRISKGSNGQDRETPFSSDPVGHCHEL
jgi:hypothetical protein